VPWRANVKVRWRRSVRCRRSTTACATAPHKRLLLESPMLLDAALQARLTAIAAAPRGPKIAAFFDFDGTLIDGFSASAWLRRRAARGELGAREISELLSFALMREPGDADFDELVTASVRRMAGRREDELQRIWMELFHARIAAWQFPEAWA